MRSKVLIIEQDELLRHNLSVRLDLERYRVYERDRLDDVEEILRKERIDVALVGLEGLGEKGLSFVKAVKRIRPLTEVILLNSADKLHLSIAGMKIGAFDDILMPFDLEALLERIRKALDKKRKNEQQSKLRALFQRCEDIMVMVSFAEAGESDLGRKILDRPEEKPKKGKRRPDTNDR